MLKRITALALCLVLCLAVLSGCAGSIKPTSEYKGEQIIMYLTENVYDLDPAHAYANEATRSVVSLLFDTLFVLDENGKVQNSLAKGYTIEEDPNANEYFMYIELEDSNWSDNTPITADDVVYAWKRILNFKNSNDAAALLYDIKNVRAYVEGEVSKDDIGLTADGKTVSIQFEQPIDYDQFVLNLTSLALAPLRESAVEKTPDWAKKPGTMICSGPFKLSRINFAENSSTRYSDINYDYAVKVGDKTIYLPGTETRRYKEQIVTSFVIERNSYYYRNSSKGEMLDKSVTPYRIIVDCSMPEEDIQEAYENGMILFMGDIPLSLREEYKSSVTTKNSLSTTSCYFNQNAVIDGVKLFAIKEVRQALAMTIDREAIANAVVFADVATGLVPQGVFDTNSSKVLFRSQTTDYTYLSNNLQGAKALLDSVGIDASDYSFSITVPAYDEVQLLIAENIVESWNELGFDVELNIRGTIANNDYYKQTDSIPLDICDDLYAEDMRSGEYEVVLFDYVAKSVDPFSVLAPFAKAFSGESMDMSNVNNYQLSPHITGYDSEEYNAIIEEIYAEKQISARSEKLHEAEAILMEDMPIVPIIFKKMAYLDTNSINLHNKVLFWKTSSSYYSFDSFKSATVKKYDEYLETCAEFIESKFDTYKENPLSYFGSETYSAMTFEEFKEESSNYAFLFKDEN